MKRFLPLALFAAAALSLGACEKKVIEGKVTDEYGNGLAGAVVRIENTPHETRTGADGGYQLDYEPGEVKLVATKEGYESGEMDLSIPEKLRYKVEDTRLRRENDPVKQRQTVADIRSLGAAMLSWLTDQVGAGAAGQQVREWDVEQSYMPISHSELARLLVPQYVRHVPETDGWGHDLEFYLNAGNPLGRQVMAVRSPGRDGRFSRGPYPVAPFPSDEYDEDIVWADGYFVRWPENER